MDQINRLLSGLSLKQKISIVAAAVITAAALLGFARWRREADFRPLYTSIAPGDAAAVTQKLRESGVEYRLADSGSAVLVPSAKLAESRIALAAAGLPKTGRIGFELFDRTSFGATEFVEHVNYKRALEGELERSIMTLAEVEQARVHITLPKESVFLDQQQPGKASVLLKVRAGARVSPQNVTGITHLVASAAQGVTPEAVSVLDIDGRLLTRPARAGTDPSESTSQAIELQRRIERELVAKMNATLEPVLGADRFRTGASIDLDLTSAEQQEEIFDPEKSVMLTSMTTTEGSETATASGVPGTASNLPRPAPKQSGQGSLSRKTENITYQTSRVVKHTRIPQGLIKKMSVSVLLDHTAKWEGEGTARRRVLTPPTPEVAKTIKDLIAGVVGADTDRGDQVIVESLPFESTVQTATATQPVPGPASNPGPPGPAWLEAWKKYRNLAAPVGAGVLILLALLGWLAARIMRKRKRQIDIVSTPQLEAAAEQPQGRLGGAEPALDVAGAEQRQLASPVPATEMVRELARRDLNAAANVIRMWLQESHS